MLAERPILMAAYLLIGFLISHATIHLRNGTSEDEWVLGWTFLWPVFIIFFTKEWINKLIKERYVYISQREHFKTTEQYKKDPSIYSFSTPAGLIIPIIAFLIAIIGIVFKLMD
jgi:hypothetical protein